MIRFGLLGPAAAWREGHEIELGSPQQRALFALLLLHRGEVVSTDRMVEVLWPASPPPNALQVLRTYVSRLRALGIPELTTHRQGYELRGEADADRFEALVTAAQGRHGELVPALRAAVAAEPLRERAWGQLMVALYRSGRQAEALAAYRAAQRALAELGLAPGPQLRELERMVLLQDAALDGPAPAALPPYATSFVGRDADLEAIQGALAPGRLVTVAGPAGVGKTRLAVEVAARAGVRPWWVDLSATRAGRVSAAAATALAVPPVPGRSPAELVAARLGEAPALLLLDNCEHVAEDAARLADRLLAGDARILATSREPLRIEGEVVHRLDGLSVPHGVRLFVDRAGVAGTDAVAELVQRLDGLPLAIELAAGKLSWVSPAELARDLRERLSLLGEGPRTAPARQRTLEAAIAWSYDLLDERERRVLRRLAVFPGSFDASAAAAVAGEVEALPALARLADASLLVAEPAPEGTRYRLLMTVRTFGRARWSAARCSPAPRARRTRWRRPARPSRRARRPASRTCSCSRSPGGRTR